MSQLLKYTNENVNLFYSREFDKEEIQADFKKNSNIPIEIDMGFFFNLLIETTLKNFLPLKYEQLVELYAQKNRLEKIAILYAHGAIKNNKWHYSDGKNLFSVQNWVNKNDGDYKALLLNVCNINSHDVFSKKSAICYPNGIYSVSDQSKGDVQVELFIPGIGNIDNYVIDSEIKRLKDELSQV